MQTQRQMLEQVADWQGDSVALRNIGTGEVLTYTEFDGRVNRLANALLDRGVREGNRIPFVLENSIEFPIAMYACYKIAAVPVPVNYHLATENFEYIFDDINADTVIYDAEYSDEVQTAAENATADPRLIGVGDTPLADEDFDTVVNSGHDNRPPEVPSSPGRISYILYTSGTTGKPKGVTFTQETAYHRIQEAYSSLGPQSQKTVALQLSPFFHAGGVGTTVHPTLCAGGTLLIAKDWGPVMAPNAIDEYDVTHVITVPTIAQHIASRDDVDSFDFSSLEAFVCMGAPLSTSLANSLIENVTPNIYNLYGSTETLYSLLCRPHDLPERAGTVGRPLTNKQIRIVSFEPDDAVSPDDLADVGEEGEIIIKGLGTVDYYFGNEEATNEAFDDGWFYTSDLAVKDEDGYVTITGRADDMILSGGELVSPVEVEETLEEHDSVEAAVVVGVPDEEWGQLVKATVVGDGITESELEEFCRGHDSLANYKRPREYEFVDSVERTATGKKQRYKYRPD